MMSMDDKRSSMLYPYKLISIIKDSLRLAIINYFVHVCSSLANSSVETKGPVVVDGDPMCSSGAVQMRNGVPDRVYFMVACSSSHLRWSTLFEVLGRC